MDNNDNIEFCPVLNSPVSQISNPVKSKALPNIAKLTIYFFRHCIFQFLILDLSLMTYQKPSLFTQYMHHSNSFAFRLMKPSFFSA